MCHLLYLCLHLDNKIDPISSCIIDTQRYNASYPLLRDGDTVKYYMHNTQQDCNHLKYNFIIF